MSVTVDTRRPVEAAFDAIGDTAPSVMSGLAGDAESVGDLVPGRALRSSGKGGVVCLSDEVLYESGHGFEAVEAVAHEAAVEQVGGAVG